MPGHAKLGSGPCISCHCFPSDTFPFTQSQIISSFNFIQNKPKHTCIVCSHLGNINTGNNLPLQLFQQYVFDKKKNNWQYYLLPSIEINSLCKQ